MSWTLHGTKRDTIITRGRALEPGEEVEVVPAVTTEAHLPSSAWMEAIARTAANAALLARHFHDADEAVEVGVRAAMQTPPPAGPGGPNDRPAA